jgi:hypothetical protein
MRLRGLTGENQMEESVSNGGNLPEAQILVLRHPLNVLSRMPLGGRGTARLFCDIFNSLS